MDKRHNRFQDIPELVQTADGWSRICPHCNRTVNYTGPHARNACVNAYRNKCRCRWCATTAHAGRLGMTYKTKNTNIAEVVRLEHSSSLDPNAEGIYEIHFYDAERDTNSISLMRKAIECETCHTKRLQNLPLFFKDFHFFCHSCKSYQSIQV